MRRSRVALAVLLLVAGCTTAGPRIDVGAELTEVRYSVTVVPGLVSGALPLVRDAMVKIDATVQITGAPWIEITEWTVTIDGEDVRGAWIVSPGARWSEGGPILTDGARLTIAATHVEPLNRSETANVTASLGWRHVSGTGFDSDRARLELTATIEQRPWGVLGLEAGQARGFLPTDPGERPYLVILEDPTRPPRVLAVNATREPVRDGALTTISFEPSGGELAAWIDGGTVTGWLRLRALP